jgi:hypothetical protein
MRLYLAWMVALATAPAVAADITVRSVPGGSIGHYRCNRAIVIQGDIENGDEAKFAAAAAGQDRAIVLFASRGGASAAGLAIGRSIREHHFATAVGAGSECGSACAFAWLSGVPRVASRSAVILFHHIWDRLSRRDYEAMQNAYLGAYLHSLGIPDDAILFMTEKGEGGGNLLTEETAQAYGIKTVFIGRRARGGVGVPLELVCGVIW